MDSSRYVRSSRFNKPLVSGLINCIKIKYFTSINPIQDVLFRGCSQMGGPKRPPIPKICHTYPTMMKLGTVIPYLKEIQKYMNHVTHPLSSADISNFLPEISKFYYIKKYMYRFHFDTKFPILLTFLESLKIVLIKKS